MAQKNPQPNRSDWVRYVCKEEMDEIPRILDPQDPFPPYRQGSKSTPIILDGDRPNSIDDRMSNEDVANFYSRTEPGLSYKETFLLHSFDQERRRAGLPELGQLVFREGTRVGTHTFYIHSLASRASAYWECTDCGFLLRSDYAVPLDRENFWLDSEWRVVPYNFYNAGISVPGDPDYYETGPAVYPSCDPCRVAKVLRQ